MKFCPGGVAMEARSQRDVEMFAKRVISQIRRVGTLFFIPDKVTLVRQPSPSPIVTVSKVTGPSV